MKELLKFGKDLETYLRLTTYPFAIRMLRSIDEIPVGVKRPKIDFKKCLSTCQAFSLTRRHGVPIAMLKEDMWCPLPVIGFGLEEPPNYYIEGHSRFPSYCETIEAGEICARELPRFRFGKYVGIVSAPLFLTNFEPDVIIIYCNSVQLLKLLLARTYKEGYDLNVKLSGNAACIYSIVPSIQTEEYYVSIPCSGDRRRAGAQDDEIIFTIPINKLSSLISGLKGPGKIPITPNMMPEYPLSSNWVKIANLMGMKKSDCTQIDKVLEIHPYE